MPMQRVGDFLALIPAPLGLGSLELADGRRVHGFLCENDALADGARHQRLRRLARLPGREGGRAKAAA